MRTLVIVLFALVAIASAGVWGFAEFGGAVFSASTGAPREPIVREAEPAPASASANADLRTTQPSPPKAPPAQAAAAPAAPQPAAPESSSAEAETGQENPSLADARTGAGSQTQPANPLVTQKLDSASAGAPAPQAAPPAAATPAPPPAPAAAAPQPAPRNDPVVATASAPAAPAATAATSLEAQFRSRKVTYNRPPEKLALDKPIDISLVINATGDEDAGVKALEGFPGSVVERDVELSDTVSAQLTGVGFEIVTQTVQRQKLSDRTLNRWQWRVTPTELGSRTLILEIFGYATGSLDAEPLDAYRDDIVVEVQQLDQVIKWAQSVQPVFAVLAAIAGALSALFAFLRFSTEKKKKKSA